MTLPELANLCHQMLTCQECGLAQGRTLVVPGEGPHDAEIMFVGEAPGFQEDRQGRPFVGPAGQLLEQLLAVIGLKRNQVYICNVIKCRPTDNRDPLPAEIASCKHWLDDQLRIVQPKIIVTLGRFSMSRWFPGQSISRIHGRHIQQEGRIIFPMYHPAAALHQQNLRGALEDDIKKLPALLEEARKLSAPPQIESDPAQQLSLF